MKCKVHKNTNFYAVLVQDYISQLYLANGPHVPQVLSVLGEMKVPVDLQDKLQVQVFPVCGVVDEVGVHPLPRLIIQRRESDHVLLRNNDLTETCDFLKFKDKEEEILFLPTRVSDVVRHHVFGLDRRIQPTHEMEPLCWVMVNHAAS